ncbi:MULTISPECIES: AEC family transporter [unclassified Kitasatospora]|uniref:AEC family transporter n=1 Tax=unclassified Kitasatospora TaxID=2633591 RepID=UPI001ADFE7A5|nr:AEC family transporter [Kitasatospora sp. RG8]MBP0450902.1 AEC family transporter [Kitasatospora sp. RG8]
MPSLPPLLSGFAPIWVLTAVGYLVGRSGLLGPQADMVLNRFVFHVAMPAALFVMIARTPLDRFANASMLAFAAGTAVATGLGLLAAHRLFDRALPERAIGGMAAGYVNSANLGIPVAMQVLGDASFVAPVVLFQILLVTPAVLTVLDSGRAGRRALLTLPLRNPVLLAVAVGAAASAVTTSTGWHLPDEVERSCQLLGGAGVPTALVALGMSLHHRPAAAGTARLAEVGVAVAVKTLIQPLAAFAVGAFLLHLPPHQLLTVVLFSALPTAQNVFTYAREYGRGTALARDSVLWSTLVSMATLSAVSWALGPA